MALSGDCDGRFAVHIGGYGSSGSRQTQLQSVIGVHRPFALDRRPWAAQDRAGWTAHYAQNIPYRLSCEVMYFNRAGEYGFAGGQSGAPGGLSACRSDFTVPLMLTFAQGLARSWRQALGWKVLSEREARDRSRG